VSQFETVQVKAGSFKAFKIEVFKAYPGVLLNVYWYSPQVKWFAKSRIYNQTGVGEEELISYKTNCSFFRALDLADSYPIRQD